MTYRGRFAPSPTGDLHLGSARTALVAWLAARAAGGRYVLRIEDLDHPRVVLGAEARFVEHLAWLGLDWDEGPDIGGPWGPYRQSERLQRYDDAVARLLTEGRAFHCWCSRAEVARAASAPHGPGDDGPRYPGTCRERSSAPRTDLEPSGRRPSVRLRVDDELVGFVDGVHGPRTDHPARDSGDFVLRRADGVFAYQLAVVVDDAAMAITEVVRGDDLLGSTARQLLLYRALGLTPPRFAHVPLILGSDGARLAKRHGAISLGALRDQGVAPERITGWLAWSLGLSDTPTPRTPSSLVDDFELARIARAPAQWDPRSL